MFPPHETADANGLLMIGGDLTQKTLLTAYRSGIFPWYAQGEPILWWSPDPRMVLFPNQFHCSRRLARRMRQHRVRISDDEAFDEVMSACADRPEGTWITDQMITAYTDLFHAGFARSVEVWEGEELIGGLYGVYIGKVFFAESMFHRRRDASKMALAHLVSHAIAEHWTLIDCQFHTKHLASMGAYECPRSEFLQLIRS